MAKILEGGQVFFLGIFGSFGHLRRNVPRPTAPHARFLWGDPKCFARPPRGLLADSGRTGTLENLLAGIGPSARMSSSHSVASAKAEAFWAALDRITSSAVILTGPASHITREVSSGPALLCTVAPSMWYAKPPVSGARLFFMGRNNSRASSFGSGATN
jgi:hypothetical protein